MERNHPGDATIDLSLKYAVRVHGKLLRDTVKYYRGIILDCHRNSISKKEQRELARTLENEHEVRAHLRSCGGCMNVVRYLMDDFFRR